MVKHPVVIVGSGAGGLASALEFLSQGVPVVVFEKDQRVGGKLSGGVIGGQPFDTGPTVLTMRWVFDELFAASGATFSDYAVLEPAQRLARHVWPDGSALDLFADFELSANAVRTFAGSRAEQDFRRFHRYAEDIWQEARHDFVGTERPTFAELLRRRGPGALLSTQRVDPFRTAADALRSHFSDVRLRQLFGRYTTYAGSDPYRAPATLNLIAHVEAQGVWRARGGMRAIAEAMRQRIVELGGDVVTGTEVVGLTTRAGRVDGVRLSTGALVPAAAVVWNGDVTALDRLRGMRPEPVERSLSAVTWVGTAEPQGFELDHHNVFFSRDYRAEFASISRDGLASDPTVYLCAQDRIGAPRALGPERLLILVNAGATGNRLTPEEIDRCEERTFEKLARMGLRFQNPKWERTTPAQFAARYPGSEGSLYGMASHGWTSFFQRPGARTETPGLYRAGGGVHPGAGVPMATLSGRLAANSALRDLPSLRQSRHVATAGGTSTRSAMTNR